MNEIKDQAVFLSIIWDSLPAWFKKNPEVDTVPGKDFPLESYRLIFLDELPDSVTHTETITKEEAKERYGVNFDSGHPTG